LFSLFNGFNREHIALAFIFGSGISLFVWRDRILSYGGSKKKLVSQRRYARLFHRAAICAILALAILFLSLFLHARDEYYIPLAGFLVVSLISFVISTQIIASESLSKSAQYLILVEILLLSAMLSAAFLFLFPGPYGNDAHYHVGFIQNIVSSGSIEGYSGFYENYPIYHLLFTAISFSSATDLKTAQFALAFVQVASLLFVFLICKKLLNERVALASTLIVSLSANVLQPRYYFFPASFAMVFFLIVIFLAWRDNVKGASYSLLLFVAIIATIFVHPFAPVILLTVLGLRYALLKLIRHNPGGRSIHMILFTLFVTLFWWAKPTSTGYDIVSQIVSSLRAAFSTLAEIEIERATLSSMYEWADVALYELGFTILLVTAVVGGLCYLKSVCCKHAVERASMRRHKLVVLFATTLIVIPIPYVLALLYPLSLPARWFPFVEILACMPAGYFVVFVLGRLPELLRNPLRLAIMTLLIFFMITSPIANPNAQLYSQDISGRAALTLSESYAAEFFGAKASDDIHANSRYLQYINPDFLNYQHYVRPDDPSTYSDGLVVVRNYDLEEGFFIPFPSSGDFIEIIPPEKSFYVFLESSSKVYENGDVRAYFNEL